jgi:hypothetical protein
VGMDRLFDAGIGLLDEDSDVVVLQGSGEHSSFESRRQNFWNLRNPPRV